MGSRDFSRLRAEASVLANVEREHEHVKREETPSKSSLAHPLQVLQQHYDEDLLVLHPHSSVLLSDYLSNEFACLVMLLSLQLLLVLLFLQLLFFLFQVLVVRLVSFSLYIV